MGRVSKDFDEIFKENQKDARESGRTIANPRDVMVNAIDIFSEVKKESDLKKISKLLKEMKNSLVNEDLWKYINEDELV